MNVSVIMTCCNEERYIAQAVRSVIAQTASSRIEEIIVVDDNSKDGSRTILEQLAREDPRLRLVFTSGIGNPAARNLGIRTSSAPLIAFLDGDDYWSPEKTERQLHAFDHGRVGLAYSDYIDFSRPDAGDGQLVNVRRFHAGTPDTLADYFVHDGPILPSTMIVARKVFDDVGVFNEGIWPGEDTEMCLRIAERWQFQHVPGGLAYKRRHANNITRRLESLLPINLDLTLRFVDRNPGLERHVSPRLTRRYARVANDCAQHGEPRLAFTYLRQSIGYGPFFWRAYAYLALLLLPMRARAGATRLGKRLFHGSVQRMRTALAR